MATIVVIVGSTPMLITVLEALWSSDSSAVLWCFVPCLFTSHSWMLNIKMRTVSLSVCSLMSYL